MQRFLLLQRNQGAYKWAAVAIFLLLFIITVLVLAQVQSEGVKPNQFLTPAQTSTATGFAFVKPFVGDHSETFEEFLVDRFGSGAVPIFDGMATISGTKLEVLTFEMTGLCIGLYAYPSDGIKLLWADGRHDLVTISFSQPVSAFGAYWAPQDCGTATGEITVTFFDANGNEVGADLFDGNTSDGTLAWHGYAFDTPVKTITYQADLPYVDGMQMTLCAPTPSGLIKSWSAGGGLKGLTEVGNAPNLNTSAFSVTAWIRPNVNTNFRTIVSKWQQNSIDQSRGLFIAGSGPNASLDAYVTATHGFLHASGGTIPVGTNAPLTHVALTYSAIDGLKIYTNGIRVGSGAPAGDIVISESPLRIGNTPATGFLSTD